MINFGDYEAYHFAFDVTDSLGVAPECPGEEPGEAGQLRLHHAAQPHPAPEEQGKQ